MSTKVIPEGSVAPDRISDGAGTPLVVTVNVQRLLTMQVVCAALVIARERLTVRSKFCIASEPTAFAAVKTSA